MKKDSITTLSPKNTGVYLGKVVDKKSVYIKVKLEQCIDMHDGIEIYSNGSVVSNIVTCIKNEEYVNINRKCERSEFVWLGDFAKAVAIGSVLYKTSNYKLNSSLRALYSKNIETEKKSFDIVVDIKKDKPIAVSLDIYGKKIQYISEFIPQLASSAEINDEKVVKSFEKTGDSPFCFSNINTNIDEGLFVPVSKLNEIRRNILKKVEMNFVIKKDVTKEYGNTERVLKNILQKLDNKNLNPEEIKSKISKISSLHVFKYSKDIDYIEYFQKRYNMKLNRIDINIIDYMKFSEDIKEKYIGKIDVFIVIPCVVGQNLNKYIIENMENILKDKISGVIVGNVGYIDLLLELKTQYNTTLIADMSLNISNIYSAAFYIFKGFDMIVLANEKDIEYNLDAWRNIPIEVVRDLQIVMTSRYCILGSFIENEKNKKCSMPCALGNYYLKDSLGYKHNIFCDNLDCFMYLARPKKAIEFKNKEAKQNIVCVRNCML
ncbi:MAG: DUF3656 domain-containing protein [Clostridia bacterium]